LVLDCLRNEPTRFNQLKKAIKGVSQKVLSQTLKKLERDGLINREVFPTVPVTVEYSLTALGATLTDAVAALSHWAESHMKEVQQAQLKYDKKYAS
jgi:DNA-binding HxlR family transcriptional regulator